MGEPTDNMVTSSIDGLNSVVGSTAFEMHEGVVPGDVLYETSIFLESLVRSATSGERQLMGRTLMDPKKDSKWERGRTRQALHFGAHVRGGRAVGAEVEDIPPCLVKVLALLRAVGLLGSPSRQGESESQSAVTAVTVDFFRKGSYSPALPATAPLLDSSHNHKHKLKHKPARDATTTTSQGDGSKPEGASAGGRDWSGWPGGGGSDTEPAVCVLWLQPDGGVIVGSAQELAKRSKGATSASASASSAGKAIEAVLGEGEGVFPGMERFSAPMGSVMVWDNAQAGGTQVAIPTAAWDRIVVSFQTLTPEASARVLRNRSEREEAKAKAASVRRAAKEAKEARDKGPIPGTPVVVSGWRGDNPDDNANCTTHTARQSSGNGNGSSSGGADQESSDDGKTPMIEVEHVQAVYDTIAPHWSHTRYKPWPRVEEFLRGLEACSLVADAGCGNGKYLGCDAAGGWLLGSDASVNLLQVCKEKFPKAEVLASDCMRLPFRSGVFDAAISIAVLHHFSSEARRLRALSELCRLLRPGGRVLVYAWAIEQEQDSRRSFAAQDILVPWHLGDQHNHEQNADLPKTGATTNTVRGQLDCQTDQTAPPTPTPAPKDGVPRALPPPTLPPPNAESFQASIGSQYAPPGLPAANALAAGTCEDIDATHGTDGTVMGGACIGAPPLEAAADENRADSSLSLQAAGGERSAHVLGTQAIGGESSASTLSTQAIGGESSAGTLSTQAAEDQRSTTAIGTRGAGEESSTNALRTQATVDERNANVLRSVVGVSAPTPAAPRHGVRIDGVAGAGGSVVYQRYCHMYAEGELEGLVNNVDGLHVVKSYYDRSNWCVVAERIS